MAEQPPTPAAGNAAGTAPGNAPNASPSTGPSLPKKKPVPEGNPAFRMMGLPRLRLPSRNWMIFLSITGSFASAVMYDKWQTRRNKEKWCDLVSHISEESLSTKSMPRRMTIYLAAPPGDGLRSAREHFHEYVKPVLVAASMDWDVIEGRKEGDVRHKTAEKMRGKRKMAGEGEPMTPEEVGTTYAVNVMRDNSGVTEFDGTAGDLVIGRHTWKEYIRGIHEGWLGPVDAPPEPVSATEASNASSQIPASELIQEPIGDAARQAETGSAEPLEQTMADSAPVEEKIEEKKEEEEKPKPLRPAAYILPSEYESAALSPNTPATIGPSIGVQFPHILGFRNTPIRIYRFLNRRRVADDIGRQVASAVLASHRPYDTSSASNDSAAPEQNQVLANEEKNWWKTTFAPRKEHEESVWIEDMVTDERITSRMQAFQLTADDEDRARRIGDGSLVIKKPEVKEN